MFSASVFWWNSITPTTPASVFWWNSITPIAPNECSCVFGVRVLVELNYANYIGLRVLLDFNYTNYTKRISMCFRRPCFGGIQIYKLHRRPYTNFTGVRALMEFDYTNPRFRENSIGLLSAMCLVELTYINFTRRIFVLIF